MKQLILCLFFGLSAHCLAETQYDLYHSPRALTAADIQTMSCAQCHGDMGTGYSPTGQELSGPRIAGLPRGYIIHALSAYQGNQHHQADRRQVKMNAVVEHLPSIMFPIYAQLYSTLSIPQNIPAHHKKDDPLWQAGQQLWTQGKPEAHIPACMSCHGLTGAGLPNLYPPLINHRGDYLMTALHEYREGQRTGLAAKPMIDITQRLTDKDIQAIITYLTH